MTLDTAQAAALTKNLAGIRPFSVHLLTDNVPNRKGLYKKLADYNLPTTLASPEMDAAAAVFKPAVCIPFEGRPVYGDVDRYATMAMVWTENKTKEAFDILRRTVTFGCPADVRPGVFRSGNLIVALDTNDNEVFSSSETRRSEHVATFSPLPEGRVLMKRFNIYAGEVISASIWHEKEAKTGRRYSSLEDMFPLLPMNGYTLRASSIPFGFLTDAEEDTDPENSKGRFSNHEGYEVVLVKTACQILNCKIKFSNPVDMLWGTVDNGSFTGHFGDLARGEVDFVMTGIILTYARSMVSTCLSRGLIT